MTRELRNTLAELVRQTASADFPTPQQTNPVAREILSIKPGLNPINREAIKTEDPRGPSWLNRTIDVLSRPLYAVTNPLEATYERGQLSPREFLGEAWEGFSGKDKVLGSDVLEAAGVESGVGRGIAGFGLDVALDPLTYLGVGLAKNLGKGVSKSVEALSSVEDTGAAVSRKLAQEIEAKAASSREEMLGRTFVAGPGPTRRAELTTGPQYGAPPSPTVISKRQVQDAPRVFESGQPPGSAAIVGTSETIATPIPKPTTAREALEELAQQETSPGYRRLIESRLRDMPGQPVAGRQNIVDVLKDLAKAEKSPVAKNMINQQIRKVEANVNPAESMVGQVGRPIQRPPIQATPTQRAAADEAAAGFLQSNKFDEITPVGQKTLFERIQKRIIELKVPKKQRDVVALNMLRQAEEGILAAGRKLVDNSGNSMRLSDVGLVQGRMTEEIAEKFRKGTPDTTIETVRATSAATVASEIAQPVIEAARRVASNVRDLPPSRVAVVENEVAKELEKIALAAGASKHEATKAKQFVRELFDYSQDELISESQKQARNMMRISMGEHHADALHAFNRAVYDSLGGNPKIWAKVASFQPKVVEAIMTRFATWWNAKDLRPYAREFIDSARNIGAAFEMAMAPIVRATTKTQRQNAWLSVTGKLPPGSADEVEIANVFKGTIEKLMGAEGVKTNAGNAVTTRAGVTMRQLNEELARGNSKFRFTNKKGIDEFGNDFDYTGDNWLHSWKQWNVDDPPKALYELTRALQMATRKNALLDDAASRWAQPIKTGEFNTPVNIDRLDGFYFPKEIAEQLNTTWKRLQDDRFNPGGAFLQNFDKIQRAWKSGVTIYSPSHHIRNLNGDIYLNMLDGVFNIKSYEQSARVLHAFRRRYRDLEAATNMTDAKWRRIAASQPGDVILTTAGGHKITAQQLMIAAENEGFLLKTPLLEDLIEGAGLPFKPFGGRVHGAAAYTAETRDHFVRMAHFIDLLKKDKSKSLRNAFNKAGRRVKRYHPDGSDLTGFEMTWMRRLIPFYSWLRKSTPLIIEGMVMRPHISLALPKAMSAVQEMTGVEAQGPGDPFPTDSMFPDWIKEKGIGPIFAPDDPLAGIGRQQTWRGEAPGYTIVNPTSPFIDQMKELFNPTKSLTSGLTPGLRLPGEIIAGHTALGIPMESVPGGLAGHIATQVPPVGIAARVSGATRRFNPGGRPDEPWHPEQLINWLLTGGLVTGTGPYEGQAQLEIREHLRQLGEKEREERFGG